MAGQQNESIPVTFTGRIVGTSMTADSLMKGGDKRAYKVGVPHDKREIAMENGKPVREWYYRIAVSKTEVDALGNNNNVRALYDAIMAKAAMYRPNGFQPDPKGGSPSNPKDYSLKFKDGDVGVSEDGEPYSKYDFNKGALLFEVSNRYAPKWLKRADDGILEHCQEGEIKVGDHVAVNVLVGAGDASVYLNLISTLLLKSGDRIGGDVGPKPEDAFAMFTKPSVGASASVGTFGQGQPTQPQFGQPTQQPMQQTQPVQPQFGQPAQTVQPHHGVLPQTHQPQFGQPVQGGGQQATNVFQFPNNSQGQPRQ